MCFAFTLVETETQLYALQDELCFPWYMLQMLRRAVDRDSITEDAAKKRIQAQLTNTQYIRYANVVFSTQWESEYTEYQVSTY